MTCGEVAIRMPSSDMTNNGDTVNHREQLLDLLATKSLKFGDFTLASGAKSDHYFDVKLTTFDPRGAFLVGTLFYDMIVSDGSEVDSVGGLTMGSDPIASAIALVSHLRGHPIKGFSVRKEPKKHGMMKFVEGNLRSGDKVVVVDDVVTKGGSTLQAIRGVQDAGGQVVRVITLVDRNQGGREKLLGEGFHLEAVYTADEIISRARVLLNSVACESL